MYCAGGMRLNLSSGATLQTVTDSRNRWAHVSTDSCFAHLSVVALHKTASSPNTRTSHFRNAALEQQLKASRQQLTMIQQSVAQQFLYFQHHIAQIA